MSSLVINFTIQPGDKPVSVAVNNIYNHNNEIKVELAAPGQERENAFALSTILNGSAFPGYQFNGLTLTDSKGVQHEIYEIKKNNEAILLVCVDGTLIEAIPTIEFDAKTQKVVRESCGDISYFKLEYANRPVVHIEGGDLMCVLPPRALSLCLTSDTPLGEGVSTLDRLMAGNGMLVVQDQARRPSDALIEEKLGLSKPPKSKEAWSVVHVAEAEMVEDSPEFTGSDPAAVKARRNAIVIGDEDYLALMKLMPKRPLADIGRQGGQAQLDLGAIKEAQREVARSEAATKQRLWDEFDGMIARAVENSKQAKVKNVEAVAEVKPHFPSRGVSTPALLPSQS